MVLVLQRVALQHVLSLGCECADVCCCCVCAWFCGEFAREILAGVGVVGVGQGFGDAFGELFGGEVVSREWFRAERCEAIAPVGLVEHVPDDHGGDSGSERCCGGACTAVVDDACGVSEKPVVRDGFDCKDVVGEGCCADLSPTGLDDRASPDALDGVEQEFGGCGGIVARHAAKGDDDRCFICGKECAECGVGLPMWCVVERPKACDVMV